jgi:hypothetical protein
LTRRLAALVSCLLSACAAAVDAGPPIVSVADGMQRIGPDEPVSERNTIQLFAARGEYEPFQIIVTAPAGGLTNVDVIPSDLVSATGETIDARHLTLYREHYVHLAKGSSRARLAEKLPPGASEINRPLGAGWYPEPLIPFVDPETGEDLSGSLDAVPFDLPAGMNQPIWIDVFVPRDAPRGGYTGTFTVRSDQGEAQVQVQLRVWGFELPLRPSLKSDFALWHANGKQSNIELLKHRLMPRSIGDFEWQDEFVDVYGLSNINVGFWSRLGLQECRKSEPRMKDPPDPEAVRETVSRYRPELATHAYFADEIGRCRKHPEIVAKVREYARNLQMGGTIPLLTVPPVAEFQIGGSFIWVIMPHQFLRRAAAIEEARELNQEIWSYNALPQDSYSPKWLLDYSPMNFRIQPGFISQSMGLTGLLYWKVDHWVEGREWDDLARGAQPGDGTLVYPGERVGTAGVQPGMRLKWLREGIEDYEYIELLKNKREDEFALAAARSVGENFRSWSKDPQDLYRARQRLGERLDQLR